MVLRAILAAAALLGLAAAVPARACSVGADYIRPSNFELVQIADAIVVAMPEASAGEESLRFAWCRSSRDRRPTASRSTGL